MKSIYIEVLAYFDEFAIPWLWIVYILYLRNKYGDGAEDI